MQHPRDQLLSSAGLAREGATRRMVATMCRLDGLSAMNSAAIAATSSCSRRRRFSRCSVLISTARVTTEFSSSLLKGLAT
jgi:hypothetical protein